MSRSPTRRTIRRKKAVDNDVVWFLVPDADTLSATSCPSADDVRNENTAREAIRDDFAEQERIKRKADTEVAAILEEIAALEAGGAVPTSAAVAYAREARSRLWRPIREAFVEGKANGTVETRSDVADAFENGLKTADGISDRRTDEASRVASLTELERRLRAARQEADGAEREVAELARRLAGRVDAFAAAYPDLAQRFPSLPQLIEFATRRKELLERVNVDRIEAAAIGVETNKLAPVIDLMERTEAKLGLTQSTNFAARVEALQEAIAEYETGVAEIKRDRKNQEDKAAKLKMATTNRDGARTWKASWCLQWPSAMKALRGPPSATPAEGSKLAAEWREASGILSTLTEIGTRLKKMDEDEVKLSEEVLKTSQEVGIETPHDAVAGARMLKAQWDGNEKRRTERDGLKKDYDAAEAAAEAVKAGVEAAHEVVAGLAARIGIGADGLREGASRFDQRAAIEKDIRDAEKAAMTAGDQCLSLNSTRNGQVARSMRFASIWKRPSRA